MRHQTAHMNPTAPLSARQRWRLAFKHSAPVAMGYIPAGIAFGVLMSAAGLPAWLALALSVILYSGAAQYASIPLLASGAGVLTLTLPKQANGNARRITVS